MNTFLIDTFLIVWYSLILLGFILLGFNVLLFGKYGLSIIEYLKLIKERRLKPAIIKSKLTMGDKILVNIKGKYYRCRVHSNYPALKKVVARYDGNDIYVDVMIIPNNTEYKDIIVKGQSKLIDALYFKD